MELPAVATGLPVASSPGRLEEQKLKEVAQEFEAILISLLLKEVRMTKPGGLFTGGLAHDIYRQLFDEQVAKAMAHSGGLGLGKMLERQLLKTLPDRTQENSLKLVAESADFTGRGRQGISLIKERASENREP